MFEAEMPLPWIESRSLQGPQSPPAAQAQGTQDQQVPPEAREIQDIQDSLDPDPQNQPGLGGGATGAGGGVGLGEKEGESEGGGVEDGYGGAESEDGAGGRWFPAADAGISTWQGALLDAGAGIGIASIFLAMQ